MSGQSHDRDEHERHCAAAEAEVARFVELAGGTDPATPVPTCPGWTIAGLARHHGTTHRWVEHIVRNRVRERLWSRDLPIEPPEDDADCAAWVADGAERLIATLRAAGPDDTAWTWVPDGHARFWSRRMAYEALVHRADVEIALGREPRIEAATAVDGIDELLTNLTYAPWINKRMPALRANGGTLHFHATDSAGEWTLALGPDGFTWTSAHGKGTAAVRAAASDLLLFLYGRRRIDDERLTVFGDRPLLERWLTATAF